MQSNSAHFTTNENLNAGKIILVCWSVSYQGAHLNLKYGVRIVARASPEQSYNCVIIDSLSYHVKTGMQKVSPNAIYKFKGSKIDPSNKTTYPFIS